MVRRSYLRSKRVVVGGWIMREHGSLEERSTAGCGALRVKNWVKSCRKTGQSQAGRPGEWGSGSVEKGTEN